MIYTVEYIDLIQKNELSQPEITVHFAVFSLP